jgi:hypothetical protein
VLEKFLRLFEDVLFDYIIFCGNHNFDQNRFMVQK